MYASIRILSLFVRESVFVCKVSHRFVYLFVSYYIILLNLRQTFDIDSATEWIYEIYMLYNISWVIITTLGHSL